MTIPAEVFEREGIGLHSGALELTEAKRSWAAVADLAIVELQSVLTANAAAIEHIGSTAVPGLLTKPLVDIAILLVPSISSFNLADELASIGYEERSHEGSRGGHIFVLGPPERRFVQAHLVPSGDPQWERWLVLRDLLHSDGQARADYAHAKADLCDRFAGDRDRYRNGKDEIVEGLLARAAAQREA